jgi:hypothetical protein
VSPLWLQIRHSHPPSLSAICMTASGDLTTTESVASRPLLPASAIEYGTALDCCPGPVATATEFAPPSWGDELPNAEWGGGREWSGVNGWSVVGDPVQQLPILYVRRGLLVHTSFSCSCIAGRVVDKQLRFHVIVGISTLFTESSSYLWYLLGEKCVLVVASYVQHSRGVNHSQVVLTVEELSGETQPPSYVI